MDIEDDLEILETLVKVTKVAEKKVAPPQPIANDDDDDDVISFLSDMKIAAKRDVPLIEYPWMREHKFVCVRDIAEVNRIVDEAIASGRCALDLETEGLDNRIEYEPKLRTVHQIVGFCLSFGDAEVGYYIPVRHKKDMGEGQENHNVQPVEEVEAAIKRLCLASQPQIKKGETDILSGAFESPPKVVIDFWNAKFDQEFLYPITGIDWWHPESFEDGLLACFVLYTGDDNLNLKDKAAQYLKTKDGHPYTMINLSELFGGKKVQGFEKLSPLEPSVIAYGCSDAICTRKLCSIPEIIPKVKSKTNDKFIYRLEKQVSQVIRALERNKVRVDRDRLLKSLEKHKENREHVLAKIRNFAESKGIQRFDVGSPKQLSDFLFTDKGLNLRIKPEMNEKSGQYKTGGEVLEKVAQELGDEAPEILRMIIKYREEDKLISTYLENLVNNPDKNNELRFSFKQTGSETGRFTAPAGLVEHGYSGIPIHGIPSDGEFREAFIARPGYVMIKSDYAGQELRIVSNISNEIIWIKEFLEGDGDLHTITARAFFGKQDVTKEERKMGKIANFALVYGGGPRAIMAATGCSQQEATRRKKSFDNAVPDYTLWVKGQKKNVKTSLGVYNAFGRWMAIPDANIMAGQCTYRDFEKKNPVDSETANSIRAECERYSVNYPIQSTGADIMKISLVLLHKEAFKRGWLKSGGDDSVRFLLTVHDEIVFEVKEERVLDFVPIMVEKMEYPAKITGNEYSPRWQVPLVTDPLIGPSWGVGYTCAKYNEKKGLQVGDVKVGEFVYSTIREFDKGKSEATLDEEVYFENDKKTKLKNKKPVWLREYQKDIVWNPQSEPPKLKVTPSGNPPPTSLLSVPPLKQNEIVTLRISILTKRTVGDLRGAIALCYKEEGSLLELVDYDTEKVLIRSEMGITIDPLRLAQKLKELHISDGNIIVRKQS